MSTIKVTNIQSPDSGTNDIIIDANGNVTVDPLYVDSTNNRVGIGTTTPSSFGFFAVRGSAALGGSYGNVSAHFSDGATTSLFIKHAAGELGHFTDGSVAQTFYTNSTERARIDSSGRLLVGTSTARSNVYQSALNITPQNQIESNKGDYSGGLSLINCSSGGYPAVLTFGQSYTNTLGGNTLVPNNEFLGLINFAGNDGTNFRTGAQIAAFVDGTSGSADMPGRLVFSTTADGASSPSQRMRIIESGSIGFGNMDYLFPETDNAFSIGLSGYRWSAIWAANGTIQTSDEREKTNITDAQLGSEFIKSLRPVSYKWVKGGKVDTGERDEDNNYIYESIPGERTHWGFIAQEVKQAVDNAGVDFGGWVLTDKDDPDSQQALRYDQFIAPLTKALQETMAELEALKAEVAALKGA